VASPFFPFSLKSLDGGEELVPFLLDWGGVGAISVLCFFFSFL
jgi:hypothetical protein